MRLQEDFGQDNSTVLRMDRVAARSWAGLQEGIEYEIIGEGSQISTNQKRESTVSWLLIGRNLRPFPDNFVLYWEGFYFLMCRGQNSID